MTTFTSETYPYKNPAPIPSLNSPTFHEDYDTENLLQETWEAIEKVSSVEEVLCVRSGEYVCSWEEFKTLADFLYDSGFGGHEVDLSLQVRFKDGSFLSRWEYDGSEGWRYNKAFVMPTTPKKLTQVYVGPY